MKRLLLVGSLLALVCAASGSASRPLTKQAAATREALRMLDAYPLPPGAVRLRAVPKGDHVPGSGGGSLLGKFVVRHRLWLVHLPVKSFVRYFFHRIHGWRAVAYGSFRGRTPHAVLSTSVTYAARGFGGRVTGRVLSVVAVKSHRAGWSVVRAGIVLVWHLSAAEAEYLPAGVREIDIRGPHVKTRVTSVKQVRTIVRWFDHLPINEQPFVGGCGGQPLSPSLTFVFRSRHGTVARASVPYTSGACAPASYWIHGRAQTGLVAGEVDRRVQKLLGVKLLR